MDVQRNSCTLQEHGSRIQNLKPYTCIDNNQQGSHFAEEVSSMSFAIQITSSVHCRCNIQMGMLCCANT